MADAVAHMNHSGSHLRIGQPKHARAVEIPAGDCIGQVTFSDSGWVTVACQHRAHTVSAQMYDTAVDMFIELATSKR